MNNNIEKYHIFIFILKNTIPYQIRFTILLGYFNLLNIEYFHLDNILSYFSSKLNLFFFLF